MRAYGPLLMHMYGVDEQTVLDEWTVGRFRHYRDFALQLLKTKGG